MVQVTFLDSNVCVVDLSRVTTNFTSHRVNYLYCTDLGKGVNCKDLGKGVNDYDIPWNFQLCTLIRIFIIDIFTSCVKECMLFF